MKRSVCRVLAAWLCVWGSSAWALDLSVPRVGADDLRTLFGPGTGVVVGIVDSGIDSSHPALVGVDSLGNPRLVAQQNFVPTEPGNSGDDVAGHGSAVAGVILGRDPAGIFTGIATDARFVNARVLNSGNSFNTTDWVANGAGFAVGQGVDVINMSLNIFATSSNGSSDLSRLVDWISYEHRIPVTVSAGNNGALSGDGHIVRSPADGFNIVAVGSTRAGEYNQIVSTSSWGVTSDGRSKPDVSAPGDLVTTLNDDWESGSDFENWSGTSFAAPHVAGIMATQIQFGREQGLSTDPLVLKATILNSAEKINDRSNQPWTPAQAATIDGVYYVVNPLDDQIGTGQVNGPALYYQYAAGQQGPGLVDSIGWDLNTLTGEGFVDYVIDGGLQIGSTLDMTLTWMRHMERIDDGDGIIDAGDAFNQVGEIDNLNVKLLLDGELIAATIGGAQTVEYIHWQITDPGQYTIRVERLNVANSGADEQYALAWFGAATPVPEPGAIVILTLAAGVIRKRGRAT